MLKTLPISSSIFDKNLNGTHKRNPSSNIPKDISVNNIFLTGNDPSPKYQCTTHKKSFTSFCSNCNKDICSSCEKNHRNHQLYPYRTFIPNEKEINSLKKTIYKYYHDYQIILNEIILWKNLLDEKILCFKHNFKTYNADDNIINFIDNFNRSNTCFSEAMKFRKIFSTIMPKNETDMNNKILSKCLQNNNKNYNPFYNIDNFQLAQKVIKEIISLNEDINNNHKFINCSSLIINYIIELNKKCQNIKNDKITDKKIYKINTYNGRLPCNRYLNNEFKKDNNDSEDRKIIEKQINFKDYHNQKKQKILPILYVLSANNNNIPNNEAVKRILRNKNNLNGENPNNTMNTSITSCNLMGTPMSISNLNTNIYSRKSTTPKMTDSFSKNIKKVNFQNQNATIDLMLNTTKTIQGNRYSNKRSSFRNNNRFYNSVKSLDLSDLNRLSIIKKISNFSNCNSLDKNLCKPQEQRYNIKNNNITNGIEQKEKEAKTYIHKKLMVSNNNNQPIPKRRFNNYYPDKISDIDCCSLYEARYNTSDSNNCERIKEQNKKAEIKSSLFKFSKDEEEKKCNNTKEVIPKVIKSSHENIIADSKKPLYIGLDLGDSFCKLTMVNQFTNEINLISFKKDICQVPSVIYFDEKKDEIKIGVEAETAGVEKPSQVIFNLLKFIGINYDEIIGKKYLWPFKLYKNDKNMRPYIKIDFNGQKEKIFYLEDILSLFLQKLFEEFFSKIILKNPFNKSIKLYLELSLPNYLSYLQKKIIEKIFQNQLFSNNKTYSGYNINLKKIKLENSINIACLYKGLGCVNNFDKNILNIYIDGCSINLSIVSQKGFLFEVKNIESAAFGEEDLIDNYICYSLRNLDENSKNKFLQSPLFLLKIRKSISSAINNFGIIPQTQIEFCLPQEKENNISIILKKIEYEECCDELFKKIISLIKNVLIKSRLSEMDIDDIILIGRAAKSSKIKSLILDFFKNNNKINKVLLLSDSNSSSKDINDDDYLIPIGCGLQAMNNNKMISCYMFMDICSYSFGIETLDGMMNVAIQKGMKLPCKSKNLIKISNKSDKIYINIFEGDDKYAKNNKFITCAVIEKSNFKETDKDYIQVLVILEIDLDYNLKYYIFDPNSNNRFECLININVVKN